MTVSTRDRENFIALLVHEYPLDVPEVVAARARRLMRFGTTYCRYQETYCSVELSDYEERKLERRERRTEELVRSLCAEFSPPLLVEFQGDPRGHTIKLKVPSGRATCWDGSTVGVPTS